jgi:hypothetical protein
MKRLCNVFGINIQTYIPKGKGLKKGEVINGPADFFACDRETDKLLNLGLSVQKNGFTHSEFIGDVEKYTHLAVCPKCHEFTRDIRRYERRMELKEHVETCTGRLVKGKLELKYSIPYCPHYQKNKLYVYMLCKGLGKYYRPITDYITFDFETVEEIVNGGTGKTRIVARIRPHTVAACIDKEIIIYFDVRNGKDFNTSSSQRCLSTQK